MISNMWYFDHNSSTTLHPAVLDNLLKYAMNNSNASSTHTPGQKARSIIEEARQNFLKALNCPANVKCIFTASGTEANNLFIKSFLNKLIILPFTEHLSIINAASDPIVLPVNISGEVDVHCLDNLLANHAKNNRVIVSIMLANNETGVIQPMREISNIVKKYNAILHTDAAQAVGKIPVDFQELGVDAMTVSAHKFGAVYGCGALLFRDDIELKPLIHGGGQENGLRSGSENILAISCAALLMERLSELVDKMSAVQLLRDNMEREMLNYIDDRLVIVSYGTKRLPNTSCFATANIHKSAQVAYFDMHNIAISAGSACSSGLLYSSHVLRAMGHSDIIGKNAVRISFGWNTKKADVEIFLTHWKDLCKNFLKI
ncbi:cysteine desulfurase [Candidatus Xenohaliotis californiensis]|uniref:Cysteine desulfurase n=1 Tax=Candidatus Xenohaliotis californiensis TaxID=84677 RepID=A0ABM9N8X9_9RICK|nr:cysteine desulfurase [Candidatus Xenohaliotis californiensis]